MYFRVLDCLAIGATLGSVASALPNGPAPTDMASVNYESCTDGGCSDGSSCMIGYCVPDKAYSSIVSQYTSFPVDADIASLPIPSDISIPGFPSDTGSDITTDLPEATHAPVPVPGMITPPVGNLSITAPAKTHSAFSTGALPSMSANSSSTKSGSIATKTPSGPSSSSTAVSGAGSQAELAYTGSLLFALTLMVSFLF